MYNPPMNHTSQFSFYRFVLPNNMRVLAYPLPHVQSIFARVDVRGGSIFESEKNMGISHFLEHWLHQGNTKYPKSHEFSSLLEEEGIFQNGYTFPFGNYYYMKAPSLKLEKTMELLYLLVTQPTLSVNRSEHVREVILNEYHDTWQKPEFKFYRELQLKRYTDSPSYLQEVLGTPTTIMSITREDSLKWFRKFYHAGNFFLTIVGNFEMNNLQKILNNTFATLPTTKSVPFPAMSTNHYSPFSLYHQKEERDQITFYISLPAFGWKEKSTRKTLSLDLLTDILGGGRISRLFRLLREEKNLVYSVSCSTSTHPYRGSIVIHGYCSKPNIVTTMKLIKKELEKALVKGVSEKEVRIGKNVVESTMVFRMETPEGIAQHLINQEFWDEDILTPEEIIKKTNKITSQEVNTLSKEVLSSNKFNIGLFGNLSDKEVQDIKSIFS